MRAGDYALSMVAVSGTTVAVGAVTDRPTVLDGGRRVCSRASRRPTSSRARPERSQRRLVDPPGHVHASPAYLKHLTGVLVERALRRAWTSS